MAFPSSMMYAIEAKHLTVQRGDRPIISDIDIQIEQGECIAIIGTSGEGKSTFLHTLAGHLPYSGSLHISQRIGMVFQQYALLPWMTASQNIAFGVRMEKEAKKKWIEECLHLSGLTEKANTYPHELSGGQQQRIAIARAFAHTPDVLLMDEPFGSLDAMTKKEMHVWLHSMQKAYNITTILVTHDEEEAKALANRIFVMQNGKMEILRENKN